MGCSVHVVARLAVLGLAAVLLGTGCTGPSSPGAPAPSGPLAASPSAPIGRSPAPNADAGEPCGGIFSPPPSARLLCSEHVLGGSLEITWRSYASSLPAADVFASYRARSARCAGLQVGPGLRVEEGLLHLTVHPAAEGGYPSCDVRPAAGDATVVVISQAYRR